ncbi:MAG: universal stress protein [Bacteroidetes bacterium]|nr:MAG: universal stress protein [Bacteroidota bacterium]MBL1145863.1 universal stress protein [Bacteroidota bacterium]MCB0802513.1 universal stress protein [Flavobacteriales bacterium]NOG58657.1 universal stress protein [Bacteroidota bacterium]
MKNTYEIKKILTPIDFSESSKNTISHVIEIAKRTNAEIHLLHVMSVSSQVFPNLEISEISGSLKERISAELNKIADEMRADSGLNVSAEIIEGSISSSITGVAAKKKCDIIVMGTHGVSGVQEFFMGSNAYRVVTASTCPVLTVNRTSKNNDYNTIAMPIDGTRHTRDKVAEVTTFAKLFNAKVMIVGVISGNHRDEEKIFEMKIKQVEEHFDIKGVEYESKIIHGDDISEMTLSFAQTVGADLIAVMTEQEARTGLFVGTNAQRIVNHSRIPVLSVTPLETLDLRYATNNLKPFSF